MKGKTAKTKTWQEAMEEFHREDHARKERDRSNGLTYSLDDEADRDYLENQCLDCHQNPYRVLVKKEAYHILYEVLKGLPASQKQRLYRYYWEQKSYSAIARLEGVDESAVRRSIQRGLKQLKTKLSGTGISANDFNQHYDTRYLKHFHPKKETADRQNESDPLININEGGAQDGE